MRTQLIRSRSFAKKNHCWLLRSSAMVLGAVEFALFDRVHGPRSFLCFAVWYLTMQLCGSRVQPGGISVGFCLYCCLQNSRKLQITQSLKELSELFLFASAFAPKAAKPFQFDSIW